MFAWCRSRHHTLSIRNKPNRAYAEQSTHRGSHAIRSPVSSGGSFGDGFLGARRRGQAARALHHAIRKLHHGWSRCTRPSWRMACARAVDGDNRRRVPDAGLRKEAGHAMPVLRDAYVRSLVAFTAAAVRPWQQPEVDIIARRLQGVTDRTLHWQGARASGAGRPWHHALSAMASAFCASGFEPTVLCEPRTSTLMQPSLSSCRHCRQSTMPSSRE